MIVRILLAACLIVGCLVGYTLRPKVVVATPQVVTHVDARLNKHPNSVEIHRAEIFMAKRCHKELQFLRSYKDSLDLLHGERVYSQEWPDEIGMTTCLRWMILGDST